MKKYFDTENSDFFRYSKDKNIIILLLDGFPSFIFQEIIEEDPSYKKIFEGFTYYRNSLSGYPNTKASIPNILTGQFYLNSEPFPTFIEKVFEHNSLPEVLLRNGFQVDALEENSFICYPNVFSNSVSNKFSKGEILSEFFRLNRITLFRHSPTFIKIWADFIFTGSPFFKDALTQANSIVKHFHTDNGKPVFKFYHLPAPHPPILFNEKLEYEHLEVNRENFVRSAKGSLNIAKMLLDKLKESGIYDNTLIFIIADHGYGWPIKKKGVYEGMLVDPRALPLVLVKQFNSHGEMLVSDAPVHLQDITATTLSALNLKADVPPAGSSIFELKNSSSRKRVYLQYTSINNDSKNHMYMEPLKEYIVQGFSWVQESWKTSGKTYNPKIFSTEDIETLIITADKSNINSPPEFVQRSNPSLFWEAPGGYPYWIKFEFIPKAKKIAKYSLKTGIDEGATEEMPKDWLFQGSNDGVSWVTLDSRKNQVKWEKDEKRTYKAVNDKEFKYYRLYFEHGNRPDYIRIYEILLVE